MSEYPRIKDEELNHALSPVRCCNIWEIYLGDEDALENFAKDLHEDRKTIRELREQVKDRNDAIAMLERENDQLREQNAKLQEINYEYQFQENLEKHYGKAISSDDTAEREA